MNSCTTYVIVCASYASNSENPEGIHQLRVAIRRTRAVLAIIRRQVDEHPNLRIANDLRSMQRKLGGAREWDVLVNETLKRAPKGLLTKPVSVRLQEIVEAKRAEGHEQAHGALGGRRCTNLLSRLTHWIDAEIGGSGKKRSTPSKGPLAVPAAEFAATVIEDYHGKTRKLGRKIRTLDSAELHSLRIRIKKLRYATEFFGSLWPGRRMQKYLSSLKDLQQALGTYHDTTTAMNLLTGLPVKKSDDITPAIERIDDWLSNELQKLHEEVVTLWGRFRKKKPFWKDSIRG
jgi:triphosphatase